MPEAVMPARNGSAKAIWGLARSWVVVACLALVGAAGCRPASLQSRASGQGGSAEPERALAASGSGAPAEKRAASQKQRERAADQETWDVYYIGAAKVGYGRTVQRWVHRDGEQLVRIEAEQRLLLDRAGQRTKAGFSVSSLESTSGELLSFTSEAQLGSTPQLTGGRVDGDRLVIETAGEGASGFDEIAWPENAGGFLAAEQSLRRKPMQPRERRTLQALLPVVNQLIIVEMAAKDFEPTRLIEGEAELLRIEKVEVLGSDGDQQRISSTIWADPNGEVLKAYSPVMELVSYRATKQDALEELDTALDLFRAALVKLDRPLADAHGRRRVRYRVQLAEGNPAVVFATGPTQRVKRTGPHSAEITVLASPSGESAVQGPWEDGPPTAEHLEPNSFVQSDDPRILELAGEAAGDERDPWKTALALEAFVHRRITEKNLSTAFASAAEVAETLAGDCTEHAVLLAALARARGIPARAAMGLVYAPRSQGFAYHMWTELYLGGRWVPLDATLGQGGIGAAHLKLTDSSLKGASGISSFLPVAQVLGRLRIDVLDVE